MIRMRDPARINKFCDEFAIIWKENFPDLRWGQLMTNFFKWLADKKQIDAFFPEEYKMIAYLKEYIQYLKGDR